MNEYGDKALLPDGLHDDLPPDAEFEARVIERLLAAFAAYGYERVKPPLVEFEQSLLAGLSSSSKACSPDPAAAWRPRPSA
jgi:ATP phosphoribosyltransferase regulatory subunit